MIALAIWLSSLGQPPIWKKWNWLEKLLEKWKWAETINRPWVVISIRLFVFLGVIFTVQWVTISRNFWISVGLYTVFVASAASAVYRDITFARFLSRNLTQNQTASTYNKGFFQRLTARLTSDEGMEKLWIGTFALWITSGIVYLAGKIPPFDFVISLASSPFNLFMDLKALIPLSTFLAWSIVTGVKAARKMPKDDPLRRKVQTQKVAKKGGNAEREMPIVIHVRYFRVGVRFYVHFWIYAIEGGARRGWQWFNECLKLLWERLTSEVWILSLGLEVVRIGSFAVMAWSTAAASPYLIEYIRSGNPWGESLAILVRIIVYTVIIVLSLLAVTLRVNQNFDEHTAYSNRYWPRLSVFIWACVTVGGLACAAHWIANYYELVFLQTFKYPGPVFVSGFALVIAIAVSDSIKGTLRLNLPITIADLAKRFQVEPSELLVDIISECKVTYPNGNALITVNHAEVMCARRGFRIKYNRRKTRFSECDALTVQDLAVELELPSNDLLCVIARHRTPYATVDMPLDKALLRLLAVQYGFELRSAAATRMFPASDRLRRWFKRLWR